jgi:porin
MSNDVSESTENSFWQQEKLTGKWGEFRNKLNDNGIFIDAVYKSEVWNTGQKDSIKKFYYLDNLDLMLLLDLEMTLGWTGASFYIHSIANYGGNPGEKIGSKMGISNIETSDSWRVLELFLQQNLFDNKLSVYLGLLDLNSLFDVKQVGSLFLNPAHGIGVDYAQSGRNGPSIFPFSSLGLVARLSFLKNNYFQVGIFDGISGDTSNFQGSQIILNKNDGLLISTKIVNEHGWRSTPELKDEKEDNLPYSKIEVGSWYYTDSYNHPFSNVTNYGIYGLFELDIYQENEAPGEGLSIYGRMGVADDIENQFDYFIGAGYVYQGLIPGRDEDRFGFGFLFAHNTYLYRLDKITNLQFYDLYEQNYEFTYKFNFTPAIAFQPNIQYLVSPSNVDLKENILVFGLRLTLIF